MKKINKYPNGGKVKHPDYMQYQEDYPSTGWQDPSYDLQTYQDAITRDSTRLADAWFPSFMDREMKNMQINREYRDKTKSYTDRELQDLKFEGKQFPATDFDAFLKQYQQSGIDDKAYGGSYIPEYGAGGNFLGGLLGNVPLVGGALSKAVGADPQGKGYGAGNILGNIGSMLINPAGGAANLLGGGGGGNLLKGLFAEDGGTFKADYEAEDGEVIVGNVSLDRKYNGGMLKSYKTGGMYSLSGPTHAEGGMGIINNDSNPSYVFSNNPKLKVPKQFAKNGGTYADAAKSRSKSLEDIAQMRMGGEGYDKATADLMEPLAMQEFSNLYDAQEQFKIDNNIGGNPINTAFNGGPQFDPNKYQNSGFSLPTGLGLDSNSGGLQMSGNLQMPGNFGAASTGQGNKEKLPGWMIGANLLGPATNILGGLLGKAPTLSLDKEEEEEYRDFSPWERAHLGMQNRSLATLRAGLEGSGASGSQLRGGFQAGTSAAQNQAQQFYTSLEDQRAKSDRGTDATNRAIRQGNLQKGMMEDQFAMQHDPMNKLTAGIGQLGQVGAQLGMDQLRLNNLGTANYGAFGDFLKNMIS